jgi:exodeoxyribonuclease VII small subunit
MADKPIHDAASEQPSFEDALKRLEEIVHSLEEGNVGLSESLERYEEGVKLLRQSYELLQRAERRIELLSGVDAEGNPITRPLEDTATIDQPEPGNRRGRRRTAQKTPDSANPGQLFGGSDVDGPG